MRNGTATADLTFDQLRGAFGRTATLAEKAQHLVNYCHQEIRHKRTPKVLFGGPVCVVYLLPIAGLADQKRVDLHRVFGDVSGTLRRSDWMGCSGGYNLDGYVLFDGQKGEAGTGYTQFFRDGSIASTATVGGHWKNAKVVYATDLVDFVFSQVRNLTDILRKWDIGGPMAISAAILGAAGYNLASDDKSALARGAALADRDELIVPMIWEGSIEALQPEATARLLLDVVYQGFGMSACPYFDQATGVYKPPNR